MKKLIILAAGLFIFTPILSLHADTGAPSSSEIINLINVERKSRGLQPLIQNSLLTKAAQNRALALAKQGQLVHVSAAPGTPWPTLQSVGYQYKSAGENLASIPPATMEVVPAWMNSAPHKANLLTVNFEEIGIGIATGPYKGGTAYYVVGYFAEPKDVATERAVQSENTIINTINAHHLLLAQAKTTEQKIPIMIKLIGLLKDYLQIVQARS